MTFASLTFIVFFILVIALEEITNVKAVKEKFGNCVYFVRHMILLIASYIFYGWWDWRFCFFNFICDTYCIFCWIISSKQGCFDFSNLYCSCCAWDF